MEIQSFNIEENRNIVFDGITVKAKWRLHQLNNIEKIIQFHEVEIIEALKNDLGKPTTEAFFEIAAINQELKLNKKNLTKWMKPYKVEVPLSMQPAKAMVKPQPLGCILIIGPWNYPFSLCIQPLISALAAGNTAVIKPSEHAPNTSNLIKRLISKYFSSNVVKVFEGNANTAKALLKEKFDHIFFTGGEKVGKEIMKAAANNLTPITLELGGKSPAIVLRSADIEITAKRLIWGKGLNSGQTCIAPDYLLAEEDIKEVLIKAMKNTIKNFYGENPLDSKHSSHIINDMQFNRLKKLIEGSKDRDQIIYGGDMNEDERKISLTLIELKNKEDPLMKEEIFGPLMPIISINNLDEGINIIREKPHPLAIYMFGGNQQEKENLLSKTRSGSICLNDVILQAGIPDLPFGGVGNSGMGNYHGKAGFKTFSQERPILQKEFWLDINFRYPPYKLDINLLKKLLG